MILSNKKEYHERKVIIVADLEIESKTTIRSNRIYFDEGNDDFKDFVAFSVYYNSAKMSAYNLKYNIEYNGFQFGKDPNEPSKNDTEYRYMKRKYPLLNSMYLNDALKEADGLIKSQIELFKLEKEKKQIQLDTITEKRKKLVDRLEDFERIKKQILNRSKKIKNGESLLGVKFPTYQGAHHGLKDTNKNTFFIEDREVSLAEYESYIDSKIKILRRNVGLMKVSIEHKTAVLNKLEKPKKVCFGSKKLFKAQYTKFHNHNLWKREFYFNKYNTMILSGRADVEGGNTRIRYDEKDHTLKVPYCDRNGKKKVVFLKNVLFPSGQDLIDNYIRNQNNALKNKSAERMPICYTFIIKYDKNWRPYVVVHATLSLPKKNHVNYDVSTGVVSIDINADHLALTELDKNGNLIYERVIPFHIYGKSKGSIDHELSRVTNEVIDYCRKKHKCLVVEDLNLEKLKQSMKYKSKKYKRMLSGFAYSKILTLLNGKAYRNDIYIYKVNPAYTSQIAKLKYMKKFGVSIHIAAAYVIGRRGMGFKEKIPKYLMPLLKVDFPTDQEIEEQVRRTNKKRPKKKRKEEKDLLKEIKTKQDKIHKKIKELNTQINRYIHINEKLSNHIPRHMFYCEYRLDEIEKLLETQIEKEKLKYKT